MGAKQKSPDWFLRMTTIVSILSHLNYVDKMIERIFETSSSYQRTSMDDFFLLFYLSFASYAIIKP